LQRIDSAAVTGLPGTQYIIRLTPHSQNLRLPAQNVVFDFLYRGWDPPTIFKAMLAGFALFVISAITKYRRRYVEYRFESWQTRTGVLGRLLATCQVCAFFSIHWRCLALPFQCHGGIQDIVFLGLGVIHVGNIFFRSH